MTIFSKLYFKRIAWSLRRINIKIPADALVLEVGSGGNPYPRANVLLDAYEETRERHWDALIHDRPTVLSFGENLPFKDKSFDYVIAAHVLEHTPYPEKFLAELQRVAHGGYIETPDAFMERINPYKDHRLEVTVRDDVLVIRKKPEWIYDADLVELYEKRTKDIIAGETIPRHAAEFHMRYFWQDKIRFNVVNPDVDATWTPPLSSLDSFPQKLGIIAKLRLLLLNLIRILFSQSRRNVKLDILPLMRCPKCHFENLERSTPTEIVCKGCEMQYKIDHNIFQIYYSEL
ncbi:class I SAM-dependent methyltransferase [bacterium]|nr:class I SAM-dependent methyltransferase [bacterium]